MREADAQIAGGAACAGGAEQHLRGLHAGPVEADRKARSHQRGNAVAEQLVGRGIGLGDPVGGAVDDQHGIGADLEQQAVAGLGIAQAPVIALHRLLRVHHALLQHRRGPHVAPENDDAAARTAP